jgi:Acyl-CoA thioester hydrolase/BAAT N-terminal region/Amidohydrolase family
MPNAAEELEVALAVVVEGLPTTTLADEPFTVVLTGLTPGSEVTIDVRLDNCLGATWGGTFSATADPAGVLDLAKAALAGFAEPDPSALLWALEPDGEPDRAATSAEDVRGALTIREGARTVAEHEFVRVFRDHGVTCTDLAEPLAGALYLPAGPGPHREIGLLREAGLSPFASLRAATISAGQALNLADQIGSIEVGKAADLSVWTADPLTTHLRPADLEMVVLGGVVHRPGTLANVLA